MKEWIVQGVAQRWRSVMDPRPGSRRLRLGALGAAAALVLAGCGGGSVADMAMGGMDHGAIDGSVFGDHVHNLAFDGERLLIGTHAGLWSQSGTEQPEALSTDAFDVMGFARDGATWLASGHPAAGSDGPADLGLLVSEDAGRTWSARSLSGEADFHRLVVSGSVVLGLDSGTGRLLRSEDTGRTWTDLGAPELYDIALVPGQPDIVLASSQSGPSRSTDGGRTFQAIADAPLLALFATDGTELLAADAYGAVHRSSDAGLTWSKVGTLPAQPSAFAVSGQRVAALVDGTIHLSTDGGASFGAHILGVGGH